MLKHVIDHRKYIKSLDKKYGKPPPTHEYAADDHGNVAYISRRRLNFPGDKWRYVAQLDREAGPGANETFFINFDDNPDIDLWMLSKESGYRGEYIRAWKIDRQGLRLAK